MINVDIIFTRQVIFLTVDPWAFLKGFTLTHGQGSWHSVASKFIVLFMMAFHLTGAAQPHNDILFEHLSIESGLSNNNVQCIVQDQVGYLWFGTYDGLNRYNGYTFDVYKSHPGDSTRLEDGNIYSMMIDRKGQLWIGTKYGGLSRFNAATESFTTWRNTPGDTNSLGHDWILSMYEDQDGTLWLGSGNGLCRVIPGDQIDGPGNTIQGFQTFGADASNPMKINKINSAGKQRLWLSTSKGLLLFNAETKKFEANYTHQFQGRNADNDNITGGILYDPRDELLVGCYTGLYQLLENERRYSLLPIRIGTQESYVNTPVNSMMNDGNGLLWIGTNQGLFLKQLDNEQAVWMTHDFNDPASLGRNHVQDIYKDRQGIIWVATLDGGVSKYDPNKAKFKLRLKDINLSESQEIRSFKSAYQTSDGHVWIGTDYGLHELIKENNDFQLLRSFSHDQQDETTLNIGGVTSIIQQNEHKLFLGHWGGGLNRMDLVSERVSRYGFDNSESLNSNNQLSCCITTMKADSQQRLWLGTIYGFLEKFDPVTEAFSSYKIGEWIWDLYLDEEAGKVWCATENGFCFYHLETGEKYCYKNDPGNPKSISDDRTWAVYRDTKNRMWVGTYNGLELFDPGTGTFSRFYDAGLESFTVYRINEDRKGMLWLGTPKGITKFNPKDSTYRHFTRADGAFPEAKWSYTDREGWMYFGGIKGVNVFKPSEIMINQEQPALVFTGFRLFNRPVIPGEAQALEKPIAVAREINLDYTQNVFSIEFAALNYTSTSKNRYAYKLEGFSDNWSYIGNDRTATYTNLDPGNYTFRVIASNNDNIWNDKGISIAINIRPPFWNTWWFRSLATLTLFAAIIAWIRLRIRMIKIKKRELEQLVTTRTSELQHANEILGIQKDEISKKNLDLERMALEVERSSQMKLNFFTNISHELRTPLSLILGPLEKLTEEFKTNPRYGVILNMMQNNMLRLLRLINQLLDLSKVDGGFMKVQVTYSNISSFTHQIYSSFQFMAKRNTIQYSFEDHLSKPMAYFDADKVEKILYNVISNAFKFTPRNGSITVTIDGQYDPNGALRLVTISVLDTGQGIASKDIDRIFGRFERGGNTENSTYMPGQGIGLALAQSLAHLHHGEIKVSSEKQLGTRFEITLGVAKQLFSPGQVIAQPLDLPVTPSAQEQEALVDTNPSAGEFSPHVNPELDTILVVEDNHDLRHFITMELSGYFNVITAENGEKGWEHCVTFQPDLVLSDIMMPKLSGTDLCSKIKSDERTSHIQVILLTAKAALDDQKKGFEYGADDYVMKPFSIQVLKLKVKNLLETRKKMQSKYRDMGIIPSIPTGNKADEELVKSAVAIVENNLADPKLSPQQLGRELGLSRSLLYAKLKSLTGMPVNEFIKDLRLKKAAWILQHHPGLPVSQVAMEVGFVNHSHFTRSFRERFGMSPSDYASSLSTD